MREVLVAAGSNVDPVRHLARAARAMAARFPGLRLSRAYRNKAVGFVGEDFVNLVAAFETELSPREVLGILHGIEAECGRTREAPKWAPRTMDLDLLLFGDLQLDEPGLRLPRPDLLKRPYMLGPAAEVAPDAVHPVEQATLSELWLRFERDAQAKGVHELIPVSLEPARP